MVLHRVPLPPAEACHLAAGHLGKIWKAHRRTLPPDVKDLVAETLLAMRAHIIGEDVKHSRYDIRGVTELLKFVASRDGTDAAQSSASAARPLENPRSMVTVSWEPLPPPRQLHVTLQSAHLQRNSQPEVETFAMNDDSENSHSSSDGEIEYFDDFGFLPADGDAGAG